MTLARIARLIPLIAFAALAEASFAAPPRRAAPLAWAGECTHHVATLEFAPIQPTVRAGETVTYTARLANTQPCPDTPTWPLMGLFGYDIAVVSASAPGILAPMPPPTVRVSGGLRPGQSHEVSFGFTAVATGTITLRASVGYEVHLNYPGPAYWSSSGATAPALTVADPPPPAAYLPLLGK